MDIKKRLKEILDNLPNDVRVVATSKTHPNSAIMEAYSIGHRIFGENKVQELLEKHASLPKDIEWHFIGHLQTNKIKLIVPFVALIHGVDSIKVLIEINKQAILIDRKVKCLLQVHIAKEDTKFGFTEKEIVSFFENREYLNFSNIEFSGLMGMASNTDDISVVGGEFAGIKLLFDFCKTNLPDGSFDTLSIGMSGDYQLAIEDGGNLLRIGSSIFGHRDYD